MYVYQYNGIIPFSDILAWCHKNLYGRFHFNGFETITFDDQASYSWFLLRWS